jgi:hypothetical protein
MKKIKVHFHKENHVTTVLPTIKIYHITKIFVIVWLNYELHFYIK